jgi:hypothetical protein
MQIAARDALLVSNDGATVELAPATALFVNLPSGQILRIALPSYPSGLTAEQTGGFEQIVNSLRF